MAHSTACAGEGQGYREANKVDITDVGIELRAVVSEFAEIPAQVVVWIGSVADLGMVSVKAQQMGSRYIPMALQGQAQLSLGSKGKSGCY